MRLAHKRNYSAAPEVRFASGRVAAVVGALVAIGWLLGVWPLLAFGMWRVPVGSDDGIYFSAAALLAHGSLPYRDFTFVHPPGVALFYLPVTLLADPSLAFSVGRWLSSLVGGVNIALSGWLAYRCAGPIAAVTAAGLYAVYPEAVSDERRIHLEPLLNMACLAMANFWLSSRLEGQPSRALFAGIFLGLALLTKSWAIIWVLACLVSGPVRRREAFISLGVGIVLAGILLLPFALAAPLNLFDQTVLFHLRRPPDGIIRSSVRLKEIFSNPIAAMAAVSLVAQLIKAIKAGTPIPRSTQLFGVAWGLMLAFFLLSPTYWSQYNSALAPAETQLASTFAASLFRENAGYRLGRVPALLFLAVLPLYLLTLDLKLGRGRSEDMVVIGRVIRERVPPDACFLPFEMKWGLVADRLPQARDGRPALVDVYADMLLATEHSGLRFPDAQQALQAPAAQERIRWLLEGCDYLALGWRANMLGESTLHWTRERYMRTAELGGADLWQRRQ